MAQKVKNDQGEVFGRNQALKFLKKALAGRGLRIDLQKVFHNLELHELLAIYFDRTNADDVSQVQYFTPKRHFRRLVRRKNLLKKFTLLPPKTPAPELRGPCGPETYGRNQALAYLKKRLGEHSIRLDLRQIFEDRRTYDLIALYFTQFEEQGSQKFLCVQKPDFDQLVMNGALLEHYPLLLPKIPQVIEIHVETITARDAPAHPVCAFAAA